jgi:multidrug efflux system outer membrane protein
MGQLALPDAILMKTTAVNTSASDRRQRVGGSISLAACALAWSTGLGLSGCALHKPPTHTAMVAQALPDATPLPSTWSTTSSTLKVDDNWLKSFQDPGMEAVVNEAIANNLDLRQSAAKVEAARQTVVVVGAQLKPQFNVPVSGATTYASDANGTQQNQSSTVLFEAAWEIDVWGRLRSQRAASQENYEAIALDYAFARQSLAATTAKSWYLAIEARQLLALTAQSVEVYQRLFALVKIRRAAGKVSNLDVSEASYQLDEAEGQLTVAQGLYSEARRTLEVLIGHFPTAEFQVADQFAPLPVPVAPGLPSSLLERRPDLQAAEHQVLAAFRTQQAAKLALLPSFSFNLEGGRLSDPLLSVLGLNPWLMHSALGMLLPVYDGGALRAEVKIATDEQLQSIARFGGVSLRAFDEVEGALTNQEQLAKHQPFAENAVRDHTEAVRIANVRYKSGSMDLLSVLQLQEGQIESQAQLIKLRNAQLANNIDLHLAVGGSFDSSPASFSGAPNLRP